MCKNPSCSSCCALLSGPTLDRASARVRNQLRDLLLRALVVSSDQDVELLAADLACKERWREGRVERLHNRRALGGELGDLLG